MEKLPNLYVADRAAYGRGVFTDRSIAAGTLVEECPMLVLPARDREAIDQTSLYHYCFPWGDGGTLYALATGYGSLYNHASLPNARFEPDIPGNRLRVFAIKDISPGEEITIDYTSGRNLPRKHRLPRPKEVLLEV